MSIVGIDGVLSPVSKKTWRMFARSLLQNTTVRSASADQQIMGKTDEWWLSAGFAVGRRLRRRRNQIAADCAAGK
jgi:hypothetical protein